MTFKTLCSIVIIASVMVATQGRASAQIAQSSISGVISGTTYGPNGKALGDTKVWANIVSPVPRPVDRKSAVIPVLSTVTANDGSFALPYVPAGAYVLCASNAAAAALNPCTWGGTPLVKMTNGQHAAGQAIRMAAGAWLEVHLDDPSGLLASHANKPGTTLIIGLGAPYGFIPLPMLGATATTRDYRMLVPFNTTHMLTITTRYLKLTNAAGAPISTPTYTTPVTIPSGMPGEVISLRVVGAGN